MNKQLTACLYLTLSALLVTSLVIPGNSAGGQIIEQDTYRLYIPMVPVAPEKLEEQFIDSLGGTSSFFYVAGSLAFLNNTGNLQLVDVSDPHTPVLLSELILPGNPIQITVRDGYAYLAMGYLGMAILDIRTPEAPGIVAILPLVGNTTHILLSGNLAYLSNSLGLFTVDISQPRSPVALHSVDIYANWSMIQHDKLLVAGFGLTIFDLTDPASPAYVSNWETYTGTLLGVSNDRAYFSEYGCGMYNCDYWVSVVGLSDPENLIGVGFIDVNSWASGIQFNNNIVYLTDGSQLKILELLNDGNYVERSILDLTDGIGWMHYEYNRLYINSSNTIEIIDVADPGDPDSIGKFMPEIPCGLIQPGLPMIYCSFYIHTIDNEVSGFEIIDLSDPDDGEWIGAFETPVESFLVNQVYLDGSRLYLTSRTSVGTRYGPTVEFLIYDLADPFAPQFVNRYSPGSGYGLSYVDIYQSAQITDQIGYFISIFQDLEITDLIDPSNPKILSTYESNAKLVRVEPPNIYMISSDLGPETVKHRLLTLDATSLYTPTLQSSYTISDSMWVDVVGGFDVTGGIAYIGLPKEVQIVDVHDPQNPVLLGAHTWEVWSTPSVIEAEGSLVLIGRQGILEVLDASDPTSPQVISTVTTGGHPSAIQINGNLAFVACRETGVQVIDLADPANPKLAKQYYGNTASVQTRPGLPVYLANQQDGLQIYKPYPLSTRR